MGVELLFRMRQAPLCSQLDEVCPFYPDRAQDGVSVPLSARRLLSSCSFSEVRSRGALDTPGVALKSPLRRVRSAGEPGSARGSSFSSSFGSDWSAKVPVGPNLPNGVDLRSERTVADRSIENGFGSSGAGLSLIRRSARNTTKTISGTSNLPGDDFGAEDESLVRQDLRTSADGWKCPSGKANVDSLSSISGELNPVSGSGATVGVGIPFSLKMLKRRHTRGKLATGLADVGNSLQEAFSSMIFMLKTLQSHTLDIRRQLFFDEVEGLFSMAQREMHSSFLWLFQQIFSCTPELMILVMILLANFTVYSVANNLALSPSMSSLAMVSFVTKFSGLSDVPEAAVPISNPNDRLRLYLEKAFLSSPSPPLTDGAELHNDSGRAGDGGGRSYTIASDECGDSHLRGGIASGAMYSHEDVIPTEASSMAAAFAYAESANYQLEQSSSSSNLSSNMLLDDIAQAQEGLQKPGHFDSVVLDQETMQNIVAPVSAYLEGDDYSCYDRTDLAYQQAIIDDKTNPLLLANYAQFLFLVRRDHDRAEELFRRAVIADPCNSDAIGCFASFLWLARHNLAAAEKAYRAALSADPSSPFHAANYAHFLWNSGQ